MKCKQIQAGNHQNAQTDINEAQANTNRKPSKYKQV